MSKYIDENYTEKLMNQKKVKNLPKKIKKKTKKANHKHYYHPVLFVRFYGESAIPFYSAGAECSICEKLSHGWGKKTQKDFQEFAEQNKDDYSFNLIKKYAEDHDFKEINIEGASGFDFAVGE